MQTVVTISLNGIAYQLEEPGYIQLRTYLERAEARLKDSPDRAEVMADLEQAIGEKCARSLGPHKTVVSTVEVERIIADMGPVESPDGAAPGETADGAAGAASASAAPAGAPPHKRLFRIREGQMWAGVCNGIAAYMNVDVTWVRIAVVLLTLFTTGLLILAYFVLAFIVPEAQTAEDRAAAFGMPFSTEDLITRAKKNSEFRENYRWRREWRRQQAQWNRQFHEMNQQIRTTAANAASAFPPMSNTARALATVFLPIAAIVGAVLFVGWVLAMFSLLTQHNVFGWGLPHGMPMWIGLLLLALAYVVISAPLKVIRHGAQRGAGHHTALGALHGLLWIGFTVFFFWVAYHWFPGVRELVDSLMWAANLTVETISETIV
jgi:phage shock protein PspC (stress-responsive transcriptional regulator)